MNFSATLSGLLGARERMTESAQDIARATLPPAASIDRQTSAETEIPGDSAPVDGPSLTGADPIADLPGAMIRHIEASMSFLANVQALKRQDEALQSLLKIGESRKQGN